MIGIITALRTEARSARPLAGSDCRIVTAGMGAQHAHFAAQSLIDDGAERLLVWGTAGALVDELPSGTLILPREVLDHDGKHYAVSPDWHDHLLQQVPNKLIASTASLVTVTHPISGRDAKSQLTRTSGSVAVDMETAAIAAVAQEHDVPFAVVRAIADPPALEIPPVVLKAQSERFIALEVLFRLCGRPQDFPALMRLSKTMRTATQTLSTFARILGQTTVA